MTARARKGERGGGPAGEENTGGIVLKSRYLTGRRHACKHAVRSGTDEMKIT